MLAKKLKKLMKIPQAITRPVFVKGQVSTFNQRDNYENREKEVAKYLKKRNKKLKQDSIGNLYLINPGTPLICAHMDTVGSYEAQRKLDQIRIVRSGESTGRMNDKGEHTINTLDSSIIVGQDNIGADDKNGIAIAMELYEKYGNKISLLFTVQEESGGGGIQHFIKENKDLLESCLYALIADRTGASDIIGVNNDYCTQEFQDKIVEFSAKFGYKPAMGVWCDADYISDHINCVNLSCGYYNHHTEKEYVVLDEFENCYRAMCNIIDNLKESMPKPNKQDYGWRWRGMGFDGFDYDRYGDYVENNDVLFYDGADLIVGKDIILYANGQAITIKKGEYYVYEQEDFNY